MDIKELKEKIKEFSESRFGKSENRDLKGILMHLKEEVDELIESIEENDPDNEKEEWGDCILLLLDAFRIRYGNWTSYNHLFQMAADKLDKIEDREWVEVSKGGFVRKYKLENYKKNMGFIVNSEEEDINKLAENYEVKKN